MKPRNVKLTYLDHRMITALIETSGWPAVPRQAPRSGWWWIADRLGDDLVVHLEDRR